MHLQIAIIVSALGLCITMPIFIRYFAYATLPDWGKFLTFLLCCLVATLPIFTARNFIHLYGKYATFMEYLLYFIFIYAVILFSVTFVRDIIWIILHFVKILPSPFNPVVFTKINIVTSLFVLLCAAWSLYEGIKVPNEKHLTLPSPKITQEKTVVVLSDLHISRTLNPDKIKSIVNKTNELKPDLILLAGDIVDDEVDIIKDTTALLSNLKANEGVYFVSGNHEFYIGYQAAMNELEKQGLTSLENKRQAITPHFYVAGVPDIATTRRFGGTIKAKEVLSDIPKQAYTILVSHSPTPMNLPYDLQVSGHTHGGQIFPFHFLSWLGNHHLLAGYYPKQRIYVSRGSGQWGPQMRFLAPSEITVLHLKPSK